jgi:hypothetical protein
VVKLVQRFQVSILLKEDIALDPPGEDLENLVSHMLACRNSKDVIEFFKGTLLGLGNPDEDHDESYNIESTESS